MLTSSVVVVWSLSHVRLFATSWTACQAPLSMGFFRQEYWNGLPFPPVSDLPHLGVEPMSSAGLLHWQAGSWPLSHQGLPNFKCTAHWPRYIYIFCFRFFSLIGYYKILSRVSCVIQWVLVGYILCIVPLGGTPIGKTQPNFLAARGVITICWSHAPHPHWHFVFQSHWWPLCLKNYFLEV